MKIAGIVLAGGQSLRMGEDKATLTIEQRTLLSRAVTLLHQVGFKDCFVSGDYPEFNCIHDQHKSLGPIAGIAACVDQLRPHYDAIFVIPVDMPLLAVEDCLHLLDALSDNTSEQSPHFHQQGGYYKHVTFPMMLMLTPQLSDYLADIITSEHKKHRSLYRLLNTLELKAITKKEVHAYRFENTNTPEQWQTCLSTYAMITSDKTNTMSALNADKNKD